MRRFLLTLCAAGALWAQPARAPEALSAWPYFKEVTGPRNAAGLLGFVLDRDVLNISRAGQPDLRLYDGSSREIPYVLRVRRQIDATEPFAAREFNRGTGGGALEVSYDLGDVPQQHNEVEIDSAGENFRRLVTVEGSADNALWSTLVSGGIIFRFGARGRIAEQKSVAYPVSRYRYLRVRLERDSQVDHAAPEVTSVLIRRAVHVTGEMARFPGNVEGRDADRVNGRPGSVWRIDFGGRIPIERLVITMANGAFSRPFQVDDIDDPASPSVIASGNLSRSGETPDRPETIEFSEHFAQHIKLSITDDRNSALNIFGCVAESPAREVVFGADAAAAGPLRLYYGNYRALAPHYDLAARVPFQIVPPPQRVVVGPQRENPAYQPEPLPFSEKLPWLVYVVLGAAVLATAGILLSLVRESKRIAAA